MKTFDYTFTEEQKDLLLDAITAKVNLNYKILNATGNVAVQNGIYEENDKLNKLSTLLEHVNGVGDFLINGETEPSIETALERRLKSEDFSVRTWRYLERENIETLGDLLKYRKTDYLKWRFFGKKGLAEIMDFVERYGYELE